METHETNDSQMRDYSLINISLNKCSEQLKLSIIKPQAYEWEYICMHHTDKRLLWLKSPYLLDDLDSSLESL